MNVPKKERRQKVNEVVERVAMSHRAGHFPAQLSGGQQQRVAIARAVISRPHIILADEPTGNLDSKHGKEVMELLKELHREGTTIIMVTHDKQMADYADRIIPWKRSHTRKRHLLGSETGVWQLRLPSR